MGVRILSGLQIGCTLKLVWSLFVNLTIQFEKLSDLLSQNYGHNMRGFALCLTFNYLLHKTLVTFLNFYGALGLMGLDRVRMRMKCS